MLIVNCCEVMHYICTGGCGAVVENPGTCQAMACPNYGHQFESCDCADNQHYGKMKMPSGSTTIPEKKKEKKWWQFWKRG